MPPRCRAPPAWTHPCTGPPRLLRISSSARGILSVTISRRSRSTSPTETERPGPTSAYATSSSPRSAPSTITAPTSRLSSPCSPTRPGRPGCGLASSGAKRRIAPALTRPALRGSSGAGPDAPPRGLTMTALLISRRRALLGFGAMAGFAACSSRAPSAGAGYTPSFPRTKALIEGFVAERRLPNAVAVLKVGAFAETTLEAGATAFDAPEAADAQTLFRAYSMTKPVTGLATMLLVEDGALSLDQPVADIFPEYADMRVMIGEDPADTRAAAGPILIRHLITHTAGLSYFILGDAPLPQLYRRNGLFAAGRTRAEAMAGDGEEPATLQAFAQRLAEMPLAFDPGARWSYSVGLDLAGAVIERVAGEPFDAFLNRRIFAPLRMLDTAFYAPPEKLARFTTTYWRTPEGLRVVDERSNSAFANPDGVPYGGSGLVTSARDFSRYASMMLNGGALDGVRIAARETIAAAVSNLMPAGADARGIENAAFGAGLAIATPETAGPGERPAGSYSWGGAAGTIFWVDPANTAYVVFMTQVMNENMRIWRPLEEAVYADIAALPALRPDQINPLNRPAKYM
ncbi:MAG: serine hydrolase [Alphaproteobacteria bacterium]|nr:serine hydrolase [Alphaproteobacteria bacterium]